jgi:sigma-B regulation protein RsbU (phosphoserine phosphatase)
MVYATVERNHFVTLIYGIIDTARGCFTFCRAGHTPVLLASQTGGSVERLEPRGLGLGLDSNDVFEQNLTESSVRLHAGQTLLFYTDGAVEVRNKAGEEYGEERLEQSFYRYHQESADTIKENCIQDIREFIGNKRLEDDLTFVVVKVKPENPESGRAFKN